MPTPWDMGVTRSSSGLRTIQPLFHGGPPQMRRTQWHERFFFDPATEITRVRGRHGLARIADRLQIAVDDFRERRTFRACDIDGLVSRSGQRDLGNDRRDIVSRNRLKQTFRQRNDVAVRIGIGNRPQEF